MSTLQTFSTGRQAIAGIPVAELAEQFGTPTYVYDEAVILERIKQLRAFDVIRYAQKANSNLAILDLMRRQDVLVDAVSAGEVHRAISAGYGYGGSPPQIVYTADIFDRAALELVVKHDIHCNLGSPDMINQLGDRTPGRKHPRSRLEEIDPDDDLGETRQDVQPFGVRELRRHDRDEEVGTQQMHEARDAEVRGEEIEERLSKSVHLTQPR